MAEYTHPKTLTANPCPLCGGTVQVSIMGSRGLLRCVGKDGRSCGLRYAPNADVKTAVEVWNKGVKT